MPLCLFVSDLHGQIDRYQKLFNAIQVERPAAVFLGGDLLPASFLQTRGVHKRNRFVHDVLEDGFRRLQEKLGGDYPRAFVILGNDDPRSVEEDLIKSGKGLWEYIHNRRVESLGFSIYGYACVPPTPFLLKDWEKFDVSRFLDPGCISPEEGWRSVQSVASEVKYQTIDTDLKKLAGNDDLSNGIILFHAPPYRTALDRLDKEGETFNGAPVDVFAGSIAVRRFIEKRQPLITLHGHIHESARLTGSWRDQIGRTLLYSAAHDGTELALVRFDPETPEIASRELI